MSTRLNRGVALLILLTSVLGCASTSPAPRKPSVAAAIHKVDGAALPELAFDKVEVDIADQRAIGYHYTGMEYVRGHDYRWDQNFSQATDELNFLSRKILEEAGYRVSAGTSGPLRLIGTIGSVTYNSYERKVSFDQAECVMTWRLYKAGSGEPIFVSETHGAGRVDLGEMGAIKAAYELALRQLLADPGLAAAMAGA